MTTNCDSCDSFAMNGVEFIGAELGGYKTYLGSRDGVDYTLDMQPGGGYSYCVSVDAQGVGDEGPFSLEEAARLATQSTPLGDLLDGEDPFTLTVPELRERITEAGTAYVKGYLMALVHFKEQIGGAV